MDNNVQLQKIRQLFAYIRDLLEEYPNNAYLAMMLRNKFTELDEILTGDDSVFEAHLEGMDCGRRPCRTCEEPYVAQTENS